MIKVGDKTALTMKQAIYFAENINRENSFNDDPVEITLTDGTVLQVDKSGNVICKTASPGSFATPHETAELLHFFFKAVNNGAINLSPFPAICDLHDWLLEKRLKGKTNE